MARVGVVAVALALLLAADASAATRTWDGGCGVDTKWSCAANWSENTVPGKEDTALFSGIATGNSTVDAEFAGAVASVTVAVGYTGSLSLERSLTASISFSQAAGSFTANSQTLSTGALRISGGSFTASSSTTSVSGTLRISGSPTFNANGGTIEFGGATSASLSCGEVAFDDISFTHTAGTKVVGANCVLPLDADPFAGSGGSIRLNGTLSGSGTLTTSKTLFLGSTGSLSGFAGLAATNLTVAGEYGFGEYAPFTVSGSFAVHADGEFTAPSGLATFGKNFVVASGGTFEANGGTVEFDGTSTFRLACGEQEFELVIFTSTARKTIGSDCTLPLGEDPSLGSGGTLLRGTLSGSGELTQEGNFVIQSTKPGLDSFSDVTDIGSLSLGATSVVIAPAGTLTVNGNFTVNAGASFDANEGTVEFQSLPTGSKALTCGEIGFNLVSITNTGRLIVGSDCTLPLGASPTAGAGGALILNGTLSGSGDLTVDSSSLSLQSTGSLTGFSGFSTTGILAVSGIYDFGEYTTFEVGSHFSVVPGASFTSPKGTARFEGNFVAGTSFVANGGTVELVGANQHISGNTTFYNLTKVAEEEDKVTFKAGDTQTVAGALTLEGAGASEHLSLVSSVPGTPWQLKAEGTRTVKWATVSDGFNGGATISAVESTDAGGNTGWSF
jgi:hypothetical protein